MKLLCLFLLLAATSAGAQKKPKKNIPEGFEWVKSRNLLVGTYEVSCSDWLKFMKANIKDTTLLPMPNQLVSRCIYEEVGAKRVYKNPQSVFRDTTFVDAERADGKKTRNVEKCGNMPVTGITFEQAIAYCEWLSDEFADNSKFAVLRLNFRLPSPVEMDSLLQDVFSFWKKGEDSYRAFQLGINGHGCAIYNHQHNSWCESNVRMKYEFGYTIPMQGGVFFADANGLYDLMGNVAEMTVVRGVAKGGSCISSAAECQPGAVNPYTAPQMWLGFRVVATLENSSGN